MFTDQSALYNNLQYSVDLLTNGVTLKDDNGDEKLDTNGQPVYLLAPVPENQVTAPAVLTQEILFVNTTQQFNFQFNANGPAATAVLNNFRFGDNDIVAVYGIGILLGYGANANNRVYRSFGLTPDDESIYNGQLTLNQESDQPVNLFPMHDFKDTNFGTNYNSYSGVQLIAPKRIMSGQLSRITASINLNNPIGALIITADTIQMSLYCALGQA